MSGDGHAGPSAGGWILGSLLAALIGGLAGGVLAVSQWSSGEPEGFQYFTHLVGMALFGAFLAGVPALVVGGVMGWHGSIFGHTGERGSAAPIWGLLAGAAFGFFIGPVAFGALGVLSGRLVSMIELGLLLGPVLGALCWQVGFWLNDSDKLRGHA